MTTIWCTCGTRLQWQMPGAFGRAPAGMKPRALLTTNSRSPSSSETKMLPRPRMVEASSRIGSAASMQPESCLTTHYLPGTHACPDQRKGCRTGTALRGPHVHVAARPQ